MTLTDFFKAKAAATISGKAFRDFNGDGAQSTAAAPFETQGVPNLTVTAYRSDKTTLTATTAADGTFSISDATAYTGPYRVEFTNIPANLQPGAIGANNNSTVQFINGTSSAVNLALQDPTEYSSTVNPLMVTPTYVNGDPLNNTAGYTGELRRFAYTSAGYDTTKNPQLPAPNPPAYTGAATDIATRSQLGSVWGLTYARTGKILYSSEFLKRHVGLYESPAGTPRIGQIFQTTNANTTGQATTAFFDVATVSGVSLGAISSNAARGLNGVAPTTANADASTYGLIGKTGLGGLKISPDETALWTISLNDKKLIKIPVANPTGATAYAIPDPSTIGTGNGCTNGVFRPFALKFYRGTNILALGGVCDASSASGTAANLKAVVLSVDTTLLPAASAFGVVYSLPLNYAKGIPNANDDGSATTCKNITGWYPWVDVQGAGTNSVGYCTDGAVHNVHPEPVLSSIAFDDDGSMVLAFMDRHSNQTGGLTLQTNGTSQEDGMMGGDVIRVCSVNGAFVTQGGAGCAIPAANLNNQGPGGGEFYSQDFWVYQGTALHNETSQGAVTILPGSRQAVVTGMDPFNYSSAGVSWFNNTNGNADKRYEIVPQNDTAQFNKAGAMGDIELLLDPAPIEIGNRVWVDTNNNGVQDANENGLANVQMQLWIETVPNSGTYTQAAAAVTDANGNYLFSSRVTGAAACPATGNSTINSCYGIAAIKPGLRYQIRIALNQTAITSTPYYLTTAFNDATTNGTGRDSNAVRSSPTSTNGTINGTFGLAGYNDHTLDVGFTPIKPTAAGVSISGSVQLPKTAGSIGVTTMTLHKPSGETVSIRPDRKGQYSFDDLELGQVYVVEALRHGYTFANNNRVVILTSGAVDNVNFVSVKSSK